MSKLEYGFKRAITEIVGGFVSSIVLEAFVNAGLIPVYYMLLFHILNATGTLVLILAMPYWATTYIIGWLIGLWILSGSGLINGIDYLLYFIPLLFVLGWRIWKGASGD
jgi:hypothetical protein